MDKKELLSKSLANIMSGHINDIQHLVQIHPVPEVSKKTDGSPVTPLDLALSELMEQIALKEFGPAVTFYSEEKFDLWRLPMLVVDPLDGTKEYVTGRPEWSLSVGLLLAEDFSGQGWIFNPLTKECYPSAKKRSHEEKSAYRGEVSRSEWDKGLFSNLPSGKFSVTPLGSIAYKLGRLSAGKSDFVVSLRPKNIWDIAGGTILCKEAGLRFYSQGKEVTEVEKTYEPPLIWCHEELFSSLSSLFP